MYGLMLPSGNDAAFTLAEYFGGLLQKAAQEEEEQIRKEEDQKRKEAIKLKAESDNKDDSQQINEGGDLPTASTNHTWNSSGSTVPDPTDSTTEKKTDKEPSEKEEKNYFTGT